MLESLARLVDQHLLQREEAESGEVRVGMLETLREYGLEQLHAASETDRTQQAHAHYYLTLAETAESALTGPEQQRWVACLRRDEDNLRAALGWAQLHSELEIGLRLAGALWRFWQERGQLTEGRSWLEAFLALPPADDPVRRTAMWAKALNGAGVLALPQGDHGRAEILLAESLAVGEALADQRGGNAALSNLGIVARNQAVYARAATLWERSLVMRQELGDPVLIAMTLHNLAVHAHSQGEYQQASVYFEKSLAMRRQGGDTRGIASTLNGWGSLALEQGDYSCAVGLLTEAVTLCRTLGEQLLLAAALLNLGNVAYKQGDLERAAALCTESLNLLHLAGEVRFRASVLCTLGKIALQQEMPAQAIHQLEASLALRRTSQDQKGIAEVLIHLGQALRVQGDEQHALACLYESLTLYQVLQTRRGVALCLEGWAALLARQGQAEQAAELLGAAAGMREDMGTPVPPVRRVSHKQMLAQVRLAVGETRFAAAWARGRTQPLAALLAETRTAAEAIINRAAVKKRAVLDESGRAQEGLDGVVGPPPEAP